MPEKDNLSSYIIAIVVVLAVVLIGAGYREYSRIKSASSPITSTMEQLKENNSRASDDIGAARNQLGEARSELDDTREGLDRAIETVGDMQESNHRSTDEIGQCRNLIDRSKQLAREEQSIIDDVEKSNRLTEAQTGNIK